MADGKKIFVDSLNRILVSREIGKPPPVLFVVVQESVGEDGGIFVVNVRVVKYVLDEGGADGDQENE